MKPVLILLAVFMAVRFLKNSIQARAGVNAGSGHGPADRQEPPQKEGTEMVHDQVCDSYVPMPSAISVNDRGTVRYFCSTECKDKFLASR